MVHCHVDCSVVRNRIRATGTMSPPRRSMQTMVWIDVRHGSVLFIMRHFLGQRNAVSLYRSCNFQPLNARVAKMMAAEPHRHEFNREGSSSTSSTSLHASGARSRRVQTVQTLQSRKDGSGLLRVCHEKGHSSACPEATFFHTSCSGVLVSCLLKAPQVIAMFPLLLTVLSRDSSTSYDSPDEGLCE